MAPADPGIPARHSTSSRSSRRQSSTKASGRDADALESTIRAATTGTPLRSQRVPTGLEDVFIHLMRGATDNYGDGGRG